jgi:2-hydroxy-3-oxopropionate reductase
MGVPLALRWESLGFEVVATSRTAASRDAARAAGVAGVVESLDEVIAASPAVLVLSLPPGGAATLVAVGAVAAASLDAVVVDTSTTSRGAAVAAAAAFPVFLDAPVSGGPAGAAAGGLSVMVGGDGAVLARARPVLDAVAGRIVHCGPVGSGQVAKACNQLLVTVGIVAVAEALALARRSGADPAAVREALLGGWAQSRVLDVHGVRMLEGDEVPGGRAANHAVDVGLVRALAAAAGLEASVFEAAGRRIEDLALTRPEVDHSAVVRLVDPSWP